jgi:hypothetical protein
MALEHNELFRRLQNFWFVLILELVLDAGGMKRDMNSGMGYSELLFLYSFFSQVPVNA